MGNKTAHICKIGRTREGGGEREEAMEKRGWEKGERQRRRGGGKIMSEIRNFGVGRVEYVYTYRGARSRC
jgi:hypothetical protein